MSKEIWKEIDGYDGFYEVSNRGRIRSYKCQGPGNKKAETPTLLTLKKEKYGYRRITLFDRGKRTIHLIHRLVGEAFVPNPDGKPQINHLDSDPSNNNAENLEWSTQSENIQYAFDKGRKKPNRGSEVVGSKLTKSDVLNIRKVANENGRFYGRSKLADKYNVTENCIMQVVTGRTWSHI